MRGSAVARPLQSQETCGLRKRAVVPVGRGIEQRHGDCRQFAGRATEVHRNGTKISEGIFVCLPLHVPAKGHITLPAGLKLTRPGRIGMRTPPKPAILADNPVCRFARNVCLRSPFSDGMAQPAEKRGKFSAATSASLGCCVSRSDTWGSSIGHSIPMSGSDQ